jgi:16S rRNA processing protein RimM
VRLVVGRIGRAHGVRGEMTIQVLTDEPDERFAVGAELFTDPEERGPLTVASGRVHNGILLLGFEGYEDRNASEVLRNTMLLADVDIEAAGEDEDEFHDQLLIGAAVVTTEGENVGEITEVVHLSAQDLLAVRTEEGREILIPFVHQIVPTVDIANRRVVIDPPAGLLEES